MNKNLVRVVVVVALVVAIAAYLHWQHKEREHAPHKLRISCANDLKQIGLSLRIWAADHGGQSPWNISANAGGTMELCATNAEGLDSNSFRHFQVMSNELNTPKVLVCPNDTATKPAADCELTIFQRKLSAQSRSSGF